MTGGPILTSGQIKNPENYKCTACGMAIDGFTGKGAEAYPKPGNISLCAYCGTLHWFVENGVERMTLDEETALPAESKREIARVREQMKLFQHSRKTGLPPEYYLDCQRMLEAAQKWIKAHPNACLVLNALEPDRLPIGEAQRAMLKQKLAELPAGERAKIAYIAALPDVIDWWAGNEETRGFLQMLDEASGQRATYMQAQAVLETLWGSSDDAIAVPS